MRRSNGIDALRAAVTLLVVFHHTAITYGAIGGWYYKELPPSETPTGLLLIFFCTVNQAWFMGLFFLLAGYYTPASCEKRGIREFIRERLIRLGIPLLVYFLVLHPVTVAIAEIARGHSFLSTLEDAYRHRKFEPGPLWFAEALLIFTSVWLVVYVSICGAAKRDKQPFPSNLTFLVAPLLTGAAAFLLRLIWPVGVNVAFLQLGYFASYVVLFAAGCVAWKNRWLERIPESQSRLWLRIAYLAIPVFPVIAIYAAVTKVVAGPNEGGWNVLAALYAFWEPFVAWGTILGLLVYFERRFAILNLFWKRLTRRAYLIYIIHPPILVGVALIWRSVDAPALLKFFVTGAVGCGLCYLAAGLLLRLRIVERVV